MNRSALHSLVFPAVFKDAAEHRLILDYFRGAPGVFVDVGANYPQTSISTPLERLGWTGVVVEPQPDCAAALRASRRCPVVEAACVAGAGNDTVRLFLAGTKSSVDKGFISPRFRTDRSVVVPAKTLTQILDEHAIGTVDLLCLDTEGTEIAVMDGFDWQRFRPTLVLIEDNASNFSKHRYMTRKGYRLFRRTGFNSWYARPENAGSVSIFGHAQIVRKYLLSMPIRRFRRWRHDTFG